LVDYAGLFPPAALSMPDAVAAFTAHQRHPHAWMLGRFIVPTSRLHELESAIAAAPGAPISESAPPVPSLNSQPSTINFLSALTGPDPAAELPALHAFNARHAGRIAVDTLEFKPASPGSLAALARELPQGLTV